MLLNHLDLQVPDVQLTAGFFEGQFGFHRLGNRNSPAIAILTGPGPFTLVLQQCDLPSYPEGFHLGFIVEQPEEVHAQHARMKQAKLEKLGEVQVNGRGTMFYLTAPGGLTVEVSCRRSP